MANIDNELSRMRNSVYGNEMRDAICDAMTKINNEVKDGIVKENQGIDKVGKALVVGDDGIVTTGDTVRFDMDQALSDTQKQKARDNIGAVSAEDVDEVLTYYTETDVSISASADDWELDGTGKCTQLSAYKLVKYEVTPSDTLHLKLSKDSGGVYQWQSAASVPSNLPNNNLVGTPVTTAIDGNVRVPTGATHLIVSQLKTNSTNSVKLVTADETIKEKIDSLEEAVACSEIPMSDGYIDTSGSTADPSAIIHGGGGEAEDINILDGKHGITVETGSLANKASNIDSTKREVYLRPTDEDIQTIGASVWNNNYKPNGLWYGTHTRLRLSDFYQVRAGQTITVNAPYYHRLYAYSGTVDNCEQAIDSDWTTNRPATYTITEDGFFNIAFSKEGNDTMPSGTTYPPASFSGSVTVHIPGGGWESDMRHAVVDCSAGDRFSVFGHGADAGRLWCFINANGTVIQKSTANQYGPVWLTAPANAAKLVINDDSGSVSYTGVADIPDVHQEFVYGMINDTTGIPYITYGAGTNRVCLSRACYVKAGEKVEIYTTGRHRLFLYAGRYGNTCELVTAFSWTQGDAVYEIARDGFFLIHYRDSDTDTIVLADFDGAVRIVRPERQITSQSLRVMTYNTGAFEGEGYDAGSEALAVEYRRAVASAGARLVGLQMDVPYFDDATQSNPRDALFGMFGNYAVRGNSQWNYKGFASDFRLHCVRQVSYNVANCSHPWFLAGLVFVGGTPVVIVSLHFDWNDITRRRQQIAAAISYLSNYEHVVVMGDFNPSIKVNEQLPAEWDPEDFLENFKEEIAIWKVAGFRSANVDYLGDYMTLLSDLQGYDDDLAYDNVVVSNSIRIQNAGVIKQNYMNDHYIFWADIELESNGADCIIIE